MILPEKKKGLMVGSTVPGLLNTINPLTFHRRPLSIPSRSHPCVAFCYLDNILIRWPYNKKLARLR